MKKQAQLSFSTTSVELTLFHALLDQVRQEKAQAPVLLNSIEKSNKFVDRLKKRFV